MALPTLSRGFLTTVMNGGKVDKPICQILGTKKIPGNATNGDRYRLLISDGLVSHSFAMLGTQLNDLVTNNQIDNNCIVQLNNYVANTVNEEKRIIVILELTILKPGCEVGKIGNPQQMATSNSSTNNASALNQNANVTSKPEPVKTENRPALNSFYPKTENKPTGPFGNRFGNNTAAAATPKFTSPINSLTPYQNNWKICARVTNKSALRTYSNQKGEGKIFSFEIADETGEIRATCFNNEVDKFMNMLEVGQVYYISRASLKVANKQFNTTKHEYEMTFNSDTQVENCLDQTLSQAIPNVRYNFVPIAELMNREPNTIVDVLGVCKSAGDLATITQKKTNTELTKRDIILLDQSNAEISLTLWTKTAEDFDGSNNPVVAIKGARISDFGGRSLSMGQSSALHMNPDVRESHLLRAWYDREGHSAQTTVLSVRGSGLGNNQYKLLAETKKCENDEKGDYYNVKATILMVKKENMLYQACPNATCNKKVVDMNNGMFRCEKCNREFNDFKWRMMLQLNIADFSDHSWISCFQENGEVILGKKSEELGSMKQNDESGLSEFLSTINFSDFNFRLRTKAERYNDEMRLKTTVMSASPVNYKDYNQRLIESIRGMLAS